MITTRAGIEDIDLSTDPIASCQTGTVDNQQSAADQQRKVTAGDARHGERQQIRQQSHGIRVRPNRQR